MPRVSRSLSIAACPHYWTSKSNWIDSTSCNRRGLGSRKWAKRWRRGEYPVTGKELRLAFGERGINYNGTRVSEHAWREGIEEPKIVWIPSIAVANISFYTADRFPRWKGNLFVGGMRTGEVAGTGHPERIVFNDRGEELRSEPLLTTLHQRISDVRQGPDGLLYVLTEEQAGAPAPDRTGELNAALPRAMRPGVQLTIHALTSIGLMRPVFGNGKRRDMGVCRAGSRMVIPSYWLAYIYQWKELRFRHFSHRRFSV